MNTLEQEVQGREFGIGMGGPYLIGQQGAATTPLVGDYTVCGTCREKMVYNGSKFLHTHSRADKQLCFDQKTDADRIHDHWLSTNPEDNSSHAFQVWAGKMNINPQLFGRSVWPTE